MRLRILTGIVITLLIFVVARRISRNRPAELDLEFAGARVRHTSVYEQVGPGEPRIDLAIDPAYAVEPSLVYRVGGAELLETLPMERSGPLWTASLPSLERGRRIEYGFRLVPAGDESPARPVTTRLFRIKYKGEVSPTVLVLHILCMFASFFFIVESVLGAGAILARGEPKEFTVAMTRWVVLFSFLGGWPLGWVLNWQRFGVMWEGFPFGYDVTDNKTQILFLFWLVVVLLSWRSFFGRRQGRDPAPVRVYAWAVLVSAAVSLALFLVPHSL
ncbi:MAG: hypothetical protein PHQ19_03250 [Candidatus Krumholzibacteria bacterium]|nr:hypothetical protein [Candidatus Krumholzibacteria bacterium]